MQFRTSYLLLLLLFTVSCETDPTTYQIVNNKSLTSSEVDPMIDGSLYEVVVFVYFGDDIVRQDNISFVEPGGGLSREMEVPEMYDRIRVSFTSTNYDPEKAYRAEGFRQFVARYDSLEIGKKNKIYINDSTLTRYLYDF
jgi:hypothetical protein